MPKEGSGDDGCDDIHRSMAYLLTNRSPDLRRSKSCNAIVTQQMPRIDAHNTKSEISDAKKKSGAIATRAAAMETKSLFRTTEPIIAQTFASVNTTSEDTNVAAR